MSGSSRSGAPPASDPAEAAERAEDAAARAEAAEVAAEEAEAAAEEAEAAAEEAESGAEEAEAGAGEAESAAEEAESEAEQAARVAKAGADAAAALADVHPHDPLLDTAVREVVAGVDEDHPYGKPGRPLSTRSPFRIAFTASLGVGLAYELLRAVVAVRQILVLVVMALFLAIGLDPAVAFLERRTRGRGAAVAIVMSGLVLFFGGFVAAAVPPITTQAADLVKNAPDYLQRLQHDNGLVNRLDRRYHLVDQLKKRADQGPTLGLKAVGGVLGVGKAILGAVGATLTVFILTLYFLANFPDVKRVTYRLLPRSRRARVGLMSDEVLTRVGGYVLGNLATSVVAGAASLVFLLVVGVPYAIALALFVALTDLIPLVGASIGAVVVSIVAFFVSPIVGVLTIGFFVVYQQFENYILVPRVMKKTVDVSPLVTIVAALIGGSLLGIVGALLAIPFAAAVQLVLYEVVFPRQDAS